MLFTLTVTVVVLGVLIFVHELGHFLAAKAAGIGVPRFSIGFGPPTPLRFRRGETDYVVAWFPLGGYVKMASREEQEAMADLEGGTTGKEFPAEKLFESKPLPWRIVVLGAGVAMNVAFAWAAYVALAAGGRPEIPTTTIAGVDSAALPAGAEALAAIPFGTRITRINDDTVSTLTGVYRAMLDPGADVLRIEFATRDPVVLPIRGMEADERAAVYDALRFVIEPRVGSVVAGMPAQRAGLVRGDLIVRAARDTVRSWEELVGLIEGRTGDTVRLAVLRDGRVLEVPVVPVEQTDTDRRTGTTRRVGRIGIGVYQVEVRYGLAGALIQGTQDTWDNARLVLLTLKGMVTGQISPRDLGGPIFIGQLSGQVARAGLAALVALMAFLSLNLAVLNLLPIPVLDGGHLLFLIAEGIRGRPLSLALRLRLTQVGLLVLIGIMALVFTNDLFRIFGG